MLQIIKYLFRGTFLFVVLFLSLFSSFSFSQCADVNPQFNLSQNEFCGPGPYTVSLTNTSTGTSAGTVEYEWFLNGTSFDNTTGLAAPNDITVNNVGSYSVEIIATDTIPCTESFSMDITVFPAPTADFSFNPNNECALTTINFNNSSSGTITGSTYSWDFGDGSTSTDDNPNHSYATGGTYTVTLTVENAPGCSSTFTQNITVLDVPVVNIFGDDGDGNSTNCLLPGDPTTSQTVDFTNTTTGAVSYFWDFGDGNTSTAAEPSNTYITYGTFDVVLVATGANGCTTTDTIEVVFEKFVSASLNLDVTEYSGCTPFELTTLQNNSNNANTFVWDFGDGTPPYLTTNPTPPNHIYNTQGTYTISLSASNNCNTANATISPIVIVGKPETEFTPTTTNGCAPETINFTNTTTGTSPANAYEWDMGNGNTFATTTTPPSQTYNESGTYTVSLTASNACGDSTLTQNITLDTIPIANIDVDPIDECSPATFTFENYSTGNIDNYTWYLDGAVYSTDSIINPITFTYPAGNNSVNHQIVLSVSNACGITYDTVDVTVHRPTNAQFAVSSPNVCIGDGITLTNQSLGENLSYEWDFGNGNTSIAEGPHTMNYATPGTYTVQLIADGYCGSDTVEQTVVVNPLTVADFDPLDPIEGCSPMTVSFENNSTGANLTYSWTVDGNPAGNTEDLGPLNFTETPGNNPVNHTVELTVNSACGTETIQTTVIVHRPTEAIMNVTPTEICLGEEISATELSIGENLTYEWDFGDGNTSTAQGPHTLNYATDGTFDIQLIADGYCGPDTIVTPVTVNPFPIADFTPDLPDGCAALDMTFTNNSTPTANQNWEFGGNAAPAISTNFNPGTVTFPTAGTEMIVLEVEENGCVSSDTNYIEVYPLPILDFDLAPDEGCSDLDVVITNNSVDNGFEDFEWDFGNGNTFNGYTPPDQNYIALTNDSIYDVQLNVISGSGCEDSLIQQVTVHPVPVADFNFVNDSICLNTSFNVDNISTTGMTYEWDFGDGNTSNVFSPSHQYAVDGTYTVSLIVTSPFTCADTVEREITVHPIPDAQFTNTIECLGYETVFTDNSTGNITGWTWDFGDGNSSTQQNPTYEYGTAGSFNVELTVENNFDCTTSITQSVDVNEVPTADFSAAEFCFGDDTEFTDLTVGATTQLEWDFDDGTPVSNDANPTHTFSAVGDYDVQLVAFGGSGCSDTIVQTTTITEVPTSDFSFQTACTNDTTFFTDLSGGNPDTYVWDFGDGNTDNSNTLNPSHVYTTSGTYNVTLTTSFTASGCSNTVTYAVDAHPRTSPQFTANTPCLGSETSFVDQTTNTPIQWEWNFDDGAPISTAQNPNHEYTSPGLYDVTLITENVFGCSDTLTQTVEVFELPTPGFEFDTVCLNAPTSFVDQSVNAVAWEYDFDDGNTSNISNPGHTYLNDGTYNVMQVVTNAEGCTDTLEREVIVRPNPEAIWEADTACFSYLTSFEDNSIGAVSWQWDLGDAGVTSTNQNPQHIYSADGTFNVELVVENTFGCTDTLIEETLVLPQPEANFTNATVCARNEVDFVNTSLGAPDQFTWDFGDGSAINTGENPSHTYTTGGFYDIEMIATNPAGCADTIEQNIEVFTVPDVDFEADTVCLFDVTSFTDLTQDPTPLLSWDWDFGDGNTSFQQNPTYIYQDFGVYDVTLTVTNVNGCDSTINHDVIVSEVPVADFTVDTDCFGTPTTFTDQSTNNPGIWLWDFGDGNTLNGGPNETHTYANPGNYVVSLSVFSSDSVCSDQMSQVITIAQEAQADFFIPNQICATETFDFTDNSSANLGTIDNYEWDMGDGTTYSTENGIHSYDTANVYDVTLTITTTDGCQSTYLETIEVFPITEANYEWSLACQGESILFSNTSTGNTTDWFWDFDDGNVSSQQFPEHTFENAGDYDVMLIVQNLAGCADTIIQSVTVHPSPMPGFTNDVVCYGSATSFIDQSTINSGTIDEWNWDFGSGEGNSTLQNPEYTFSDYTQAHEVSLTLTSDQGCTNTVSQNVNLLPLVDFDIFIESNTGCAPFEVTFENSSSIEGADILIYSWDFDDGTTSFQESPVHIFNEPGEYEVTLSISTSTDCQIINQEEMIITVNPTPIAGFDVSPPNTTIVTPTIEITDESHGATDWEYILDDGFFNNSASFNHTYEEVGEFEITQYVQNEYGCIDTALRAVSIKEDLIFYVPNTFTPDGNGRNDIFSWEIEGHESFEFRIFNRWGEEIFTTTDPYDTWDGTYLGQEVKEGVYVWQAKILDLKDEEHLITGHLNVLR